MFSKDILYIEFSYGNTCEFYYHDREGNLETTVVNRSSVDITAISSLPNYRGRFYPNIDNLGILHRHGDTIITKLGGALTLEGLDNYVY